MVISRTRIALTLASKHFLNSSIQKTRVEELDGEKEAYKLWGPHIQIYSARSPLNRRRFLQLKADWKALEIYKILRLRDSSPYIVYLRYQSVCRSSQTSSTSKDSTSKMYFCLRNAFLFYPLKVRFQCKKY